MSLIETITRTCFVRPHPAGYPFLIAGLALTLLFLLIYDPLGVFFALLTAAMYFFFRDPARTRPMDDALIVAPADGRIVNIVENIALPAEMLAQSVDDGKNGETDLLGQKKFTKISIFLSVLDVHVNRSPVRGQVVAKNYIEGKFVNAELDKASEENERCLLLMEQSAPAGKTTAKKKTDATANYIGVVQIAGLIARRIVCEVEKNSLLALGERFGIIRFGSRVDLYVPENASVMVGVGQRTIGGETVMADLSGPAGVRTTYLNEASEDASENQTLPPQKEA